jgi:hypothetical protein
MNLEIRTEQQECHELLAGLTHGHRTPPSRAEAGHGMGGAPPRPASPADIATSIAAGSATRTPLTTWHSLPAIQSWAAGRSAPGRSASRESGSRSATRWSGPRCVGCAHRRPPPAPEHRGARQRGYGYRCRSS